MRTDPTGQFRGDQDLVVGGYSIWTPPGRELTVEAPDGTESHTWLMGSDTAVCGTDLLEITNKVCDSVRSRRP